MIFGPASARFIARSVSGMLVWVEADSPHTNKSTNKSDGRKWSPSHTNGQSILHKTLIFNQFRTKLDVCGLKSGAQERIGRFLKPIPAISAT
jgi:hypothetical protein